MKINITISQALDALVGKNALSVPFLGVDECRSLLVEAAKIPLSPLQPVVAKGRVVQQIDRAEFVGPARSKLAKKVQLMKETVESFFHEVDPYLFTNTLDFNEMSLQCYPVGGGISPHVDGKKFQNLIALIIIGGKGSLYTCDDRAGKNPVPVDCSPGRLVLLPARNFLQEYPDTPFHFLKNVTSKRYVIGLRQIVRKQG